METRCDFFFVVALVPETGPNRYFILTHQQIKDARELMPKTKKTGEPYKRVGLTVSNGPSSSRTRTPGIASPLGKTLPVNGWFLARRRRSPPTCTSTATPRLSGTASKPGAELLPPADEIAEQSKVPEVPPHHRARTATAHRPAHRIGRGVGHRSYPPPL